MCVNNMEAKTSFWYFVFNFLFIWETTFKYLIYLFASSKSFSSSSVENYIL